MQPSGTSISVQIPTQTDSSKWWSIRDATSLKGMHPPPHTGPSENSVVSLCVKLTVSKPQDAGDSDFLSWKVLFSSSPQGLSLFGTLISLFFTGECKSDDSDIFSKLDWLSDASLWTNELSWAVGFLELLFSTIEWYFFWWLSEYNWNSSTKDFQSLIVSGRRSVRTFSKKLSIMKIFTQYL